MIQNAFLIQDNDDSKHMSVCTYNMETKNEIFLISSLIIAIEANYSICQSNYAIKYYIKSKHLNSFVYTWLQRDMDPLNKKVLCQVHMDHLSQYEKWQVQATHSVKYLYYVLRRVCPLGGHFFLTLKSAKYELFC